GRTVDYDLLCAIPPNLGPAVIDDSGLGDGAGYAITDPRTLRSRKAEGIYLLGDNTNVATSKAGSVAHFEAEVLAGNLINLLTGGQPVHQYDGKSFCFIETGLSEATYLSFNYDNPPPMVAPSQSIHWFKQAYNRIHWTNLKAIV
ncbi:MAG TPA: NAD(P)/FAD-dependent oxidoreductase, partial [Symbiobacteriaceae bacterium]|nr:NAD(P)/FAD-dependent oxidoreductase [Symbiobacteriaceae bacterium]